MKNANSEKDQKQPAGSQGFGNTALIPDAELDGLAAGATVDEVGSSLYSLMRLLKDIENNTALSKEAKDAAVSAAWQAENGRLFPSSDK